MLTCKHQNLHHSKLPSLGIFGLSTLNPRPRCMVSHYSLTDSPDDRYSLGIHTVFVRFLDNGDLQRLSGIWFQEE